MRTRDKQANPTTARQCFAEPAPFQDTPPHQCTIIARTIKTSPPIKLTSPNMPPITRSTPSAPDHGTPSATRPRIGVSACLLGHKVRYDGAAKPLLLLEELASDLDLVPLCPETAIGLPVPRPPLRLQQTANGARILGIADPQHDVTDALVNLANRTAHNTCRWAGFILKSRSPSCGLNSTPLYSSHGNPLGMSSGAFAERLASLLPGIPIVDEHALQDINARQAFIKAVSERSE